MSDEEQKQATPEPAPAKPATVKPATVKPAPAAGVEKPAKAAPPPDPRIVAAKDAAQAIQTALQPIIGDDAIEEAGAAHIRPMLRIKKEKWFHAIQALKTHQDYLLDYVECMAGADYPDYIEIVAYVQSTKMGHFVCLKTRTDKENASVPSLVEAHPGVNWEEREIFDLLGVEFTNHPDLRRIMMPEDYVGHPLRKDFSPWD